MTTEFKKEYRYSTDLLIGDKISIGGLVHAIVKVEHVFHYVPDAFVRVELMEPSAKSKKEKVTLFLPRMKRIEILK